MNKQPVLERLPHINSVEAIKNFLYVLYDDFNLVFSPSQPFQTYLDANGQPIFTTQEAHELNTKLHDCINFCIIRHLDFRQICDSVQIKAFFKMAVFSDTLLQEHLS